MVKLNNLPGIQLRSRWNTSFDRQTTPSRSQKVCHWSSDTRIEKTIFILNFVWGNNIYFVLMCIYGRQHSLQNVYEKHLLYSLQNVYGKTTFTSIFVWIYHYKCMFSGCITLIFRRKNNKSVLNKVNDRNKSQESDLLYGCRAVPLQYTLHVVVVIRVHNAVQAAVHQIHLQCKVNTFYPFEF